MYSNNYLKLHPLAFGFAFGIIAAIWMFVLGLFSMRGYGGAYVTSMSSVYAGYGPTFLGSVLGAIWGFVGSFIFGVIVAALYNWFTCCSRKSACRGSCQSCGCNPCKCGNRGEVCKVHGAACNIKDHEQPKPFKPFDHHE